MHSRIDLARAAGEEYLRREPDRAGQLLCVGGAEPIADEREAPAPRADAAGGLVRDERTEGAEPGIARHALLVRRAHAGQHRRLERRRDELPLDEDPLARELVDVVRLGHLFPAPYVLVEERTDARGRVNVEVPPPHVRGVGNGALLEERGCEERAAGDHDVTREYAELPSGVARRDPSDQILTVQRVTDRWNRSGA